MTKSELRRVYLDERGSLSQEDRKDASKRIADNFFDDFDLNEIRFLHCFVSIERLNEIDTRPIFERLWDEFPQVMTVVPRIDHETGDLESLIYSPETAVAEGAWRINEPIHDEAVPPKEIDIVLVPLVCFDRQGHRAGYGKGFYDRFLRRCRAGCLKIGLSFFEPVDRIDDVHPGDVALDFAVTPSGLFVPDPGKDQRRPEPLELKEENN